MRDNDGGKGASQARWKIVNEVFKPLGMEVSHPEGKPPQNEDFIRALLKQSAKIHRETTREINPSALSGRCIGCHKFFSDRTDKRIVLRQCGYCNSSIHCGWVSYQKYDNDHPEYSCIFCFYQIFSICLLYDLSDLYKFKSPEDPEQIMSRESVHSRISETIENFFLQGRDVEKMERLLKHYANYYSDRLQEQIYEGIDNYSLSEEEIHEAARSGVDDSKDEELQAEINGFSDWILENKSSLLYWDKTGIFLRIDELVPIEDPIIKFDNKSDYDFSSCLPGSHPPIDEPESYTVHDI